MLSLNKHRIIVYNSHMHRTVKSAGPISLLICILLFSSCSTPPPVATNTPVIFVPAATETSVPPSSTPDPTSTAAPARPRPQYTMNVVLDYAAKTVSVDETIIYPNHTGQYLSDLVLAVEPNYWPGCFTLVALNLDNTPAADYALDGHKLAVRLPAQLVPESTITLQIRYTLTLPLIEPTNPNLSRPRIFGYSPKQVNLTNWYPFVVPNIAGEWVLHDAWAYGEHLVYDVADFVVNLKFADPAETPVVASSGAPAPNGEWTAYTLTAGRTFALSASTEFLTNSVQVGSTTVTSYFFQFFEGSGKAAMNAAAQALQAYTQRFGPYPHSTLAVVMGDFNDGMEFSGFFFLSRDFYNLYDGTQKNYLIFVAAHETAHQWWFEQVANDQALQPWLDEALATYSEHVFYESIDTHILSWWWVYRIDFYNPQGFVDIPVYDGGGFRPYTNAVYFRGAHFLDDLRTRLGDEVFFAFLQDYLAQENGKIATATDFFRILRLHTQADLSDLIRKYFQNLY